LGEKAQLLAADPVSSSGQEHIVTGLFCINQGGQVHYYVKTYPPCWLLVACFFSGSILFPLSTCIVLHFIIVCFVSFFLGKTCVLSGLVLHAVCTSLAPACISVYFQVSLEQWAFLLFSFVFGNPYMLLHSGFSEAGLVKKHRVILGLWSGFCRGQRRVGRGLVCELYYDGVGTLPPATQHVISFVEHMRIS